MSLLGNLTPSSTPTMAQVLERDKAQIFTGCCLCFSLPGMQSGEAKDLASHGPTLYLLCSFIRAFTYLFSKYLLSAYYVPRFPP